MNKLNKIASYLVPPPNTTKLSDTNINDEDKNSTALKYQLMKETVKGLIEENEKKGIF